MDPVYTFSVPKEQMVAGAFESLSHIMETYFSEPDEQNVSDELAEALMRNIIRNMRMAVENPRAAFAVLLQLFRPPEAVKKGISSTRSSIPPPRVGKNVAILPFAYVAEDAEIGDNTVIYPHVYVGRHVKIGSDCTCTPM